MLWVRHATLRRAPQRAFTMVELLLVLVILATLAAIVVPKFAGRSEQARVTAAQTEVANIEIALDAFEVDNGHYPQGDDGLLDLMNEPEDATNWRGPYLKKAVGVDPWKNSYIYQCPGDHDENGYDLMSTGPDGRVGGNDDIVSWGEE
jgi:general secretion pathway protein G